MTFREKGLKEGLLPIPVRESLRDYPRLAAHGVSGAMTRSMSRSCQTRRVKHVGAEILQRSEQVATPSFLAAKSEATDHGTKHHLLEACHDFNRRICTNLLFLKSHFCAFQPASLARNRGNPILPRRWQRACQPSDKADFRNAGSTSEGPESDLERAPL